MMEMDCWESYICVNSINICIVLWVIYPIFAELNLFSCDSGDCKSKIKVLAGYSESSLFGS